MSDRPSVTRVVKYIRKGVGISYTSVEYADSTSNSVPPTSGWKTTAPPWQNGRYIWQRVHIVYTDGTDGYSNPVCLSGGKGISEIVEYYLSTSASEGVTTSHDEWDWRTEGQKTDPYDKYLWNYEVVIYTDGTKTVTEPVIIGTYGDTGVGIKSIKEYYVATWLKEGVKHDNVAWEDTIQTIDKEFKYLWNYEIVTYTDNSIFKTEPVIIGVYGDDGPEGPQGPEGTGAPYIELSRTSILYQANNNGNSTTNQDFEINCYLKVSENTCTISSTGNISITSITGVEVDKNSVSKITVKIPNDKIIAGVIAVQMTGTYDGKSYTAKASITVEPNREGPQGPEGPEGPQGPQGGTGGTGPRGYRGPGLRGPQDWTLMDIGYQFYQGDESTQEPYEDFVVYDGYYYKCIKSHTKTSSNYPLSIADERYGYWQLSDKLEMVAANVLFAKHGYFGSAIISGDWLISTNGTIDGTAYNDGASYQGVIAYSLFNPDNPLGNTIIKYNSQSTVSFTASETTKTIETISLESGKVYYIEVTGRVSSTSGYFFVRLRRVSTEEEEGIYTLVRINSTSSVTSTGYVNIMTTGSYYLEVYNSGGISGVITKTKVIEKNFAPVYALDLLTGKTYQGDAHVRGVIRANLFYGKTKSINAATYQIDPNTDPFSTFLYPDANGKKWIYLPQAADYDGIEIMIYQKNTNASLNITENYLRIAPKQNSGDSIFISENIVTMNGNTLRNYSSELYPVTSSVYLLPNCRYVFKSMLGAWYAIDGVFTGE